MKGMTLVELLVAIAILGVGLTVSAMSFAPLFDRESLEPTRPEAKQAIMRGTAVGVPGDSTDPAVFYLPDGRAVGARDPMIGGLRATK